MTVAPGTSQWFPLPYGPFGESLRDPLGFLMRARELYGDVFRMRMGPLLVHWIFHPDHVRRVLQEKQKNYLRGWHYRLLSGLFGSNLVVTEGEAWVRKRRLAQPAFHRQRLAGYAETMAAATREMLAQWRTAGVGEMDATVEMRQLSLSIVGRTLFGRDTGREVDLIGQHYGVVEQFLRQRFDSPFFSPLAWIPTPINIRFKRARQALYRLVLDIIQERRMDGRDHGDLLSMLMAAQDEETGTSLSDDELRSEVLTFFLAGHETTATVLAWTLFLLGTRPAVRERIREDGRAVFAGGLPAAEAVSKLAYARMVIEESMRLYPPVWAVIREAQQADEIGGFHIPRRSMVAISPFAMHRHPDIWERPDEFDPERFMPERVAQRPKCAYIPFLAGPHQCIGNEFAMLEATLIVSLVLSEFDVELVGGQTIEPRATIGLRPSGPVLVKVAVREARPA